MKAVGQKPEGFPRMCDRLGGGLGVALGLLMTCTVSLGNLPEGLAQTPAPGFLIGEVTARNEGTIQINKHTYAIHSQVSIRDDEGQPRDVDDLVVGSIVQFQLTDGELEQVILILYGT